MHRGLVVVVLAGVLTAPLIAGAPLGTHAVRGVVKSLTATTIVITQSAKHGGEMRFVVTASTERAGSLTIGSRVSIRYIRQRDRLVATAVAADP